jgi:GNAT superfamily N-acetyltransferase
MIRPAEPRDVPILATLIRELARYEKLEHEAVATEEQIRDSLFGHAPPHAEVLVVEPAEAGRVVGFALFFHNYSTFLGRRGLYLEDLFVLADWRRRGYGAALLRALARVAVDRGCGRLEWSVLAWNEPALRFYESLGAKLMVEWRICRVTGAAMERLANEDDDA